MLFHWRMLYHNLLLWFESSLFFKKDVLNIRSIPLQVECCKRWKLKHVGGRSIPWRIGSFPCISLRGIVVWQAARQHAIYNQVHAQASMRYSAAARDLVGWLMQSGLPSKSPQSHSWRKPAWWRSPCMTKVWERFGPCIGELKESDAITACPQSGGTLYVLRTWRLKSVSRTVLAEDVAQLEPMHHASHTVWYRIPGDAITGNGEWHKVYGFLDGYLKAFPCP